MKKINFKKVVEEAVAGFYISHVDGYFLYTNKKFANILGYENFDDIKKTHIPKDIYYSPEDRKSFLNELTKKGYVEGFVVKLKKKDGSLIYVTLSGRYNPEDKTLSGWIIDITDLIKTTEELKLKNRIIEENPDAIFICKYNGEITYSNKAFADLIGATHDEIKYTVNLFPIDSNYKATIKNIVDTVKKKGIFTGEINVINRENKIIPCGVKIFALFNREGKIEYFINIFRDISAKKELEAQLAQTQKLEILGKMTSSIVHDMNNIISSLMSYLELLRIFRKNREKFERYYRKIEKLVENSGKLVERVLKFTRRTKIAKGVLNIDEVLEDIGALIEFLVHNKPEIKIDIIKNANDLKIIGNKSSFIQILLNLIVNSIDAIIEAKRKEGYINIYFDRISIKDNYFVRIIVEDNGIGIDDSIKDEIFKPFFSTKKYKDRSGTGLGLAIVAQEVESMNGKVSVCSRKNEGTRFILIFPEHNGEKVIEIPEKLEPAKEIKKTILIIDDDQYFSESIGELLKYYGFNVKFAENGEEGIEIVKKEKIDLILLDFVLPDTHPRNILEFLKENHPKIPVIIMSGIVDSNVVELQIYKNVKKILSKPITGEDLVRKIFEVI